ncbi:helix-turn-helix domain-containing protein [Pelagibacterium limicola]|uniref:helix-turn-helix domain-containing protein n=1 Tax=Pelagibacterium limicola TaxID=2791022 RepID=UPI0018AFF729|nr:helix-turn-helix domain-containing protein [Pelagibacterium limicola]
MVKEESSGIRAASRILAVLQAMNREPYSTIQSLHEVTGLPKPTLVRMLKTLEAHGFVSNDRRQAGYQITSLVTSLSNGFHGDPLVVEAGRAWAIGLSAQFKWPVAIAVFDGRKAMVVRYSTVHDSPVSPFHATINMRLSLFTRAIGRAYLSACSDGQIAALIEKMKKDNELESPEARDPAAVSRMVRTVRDRGYAMRDPSVEPRTSDTIAVPIFARGAVQASLGLTYFRSALNSFGSHGNFVSALKDAAAGIGAEVDRLQAAHERSAVAP